MHKSKKQTKQRRFQKHEKNANRTYDHKTLRPPASVDRKQTIRFCRNIYNRPPSLPDDFKRVFFALLAQA